MGILYENRAFAFSINEILVLMLVFHFVTIYRAFSTLFFKLYVTFRHSENKGTRTFYLQQLHLVIIVDSSSHCNLVCSFYETFFWQFLKLLTERCSSLAIACI